jgi:hypothetical protein
MDRAGLTDQRNRTGTLPEFPGQNSIQPAKILRAIIPYLQLSSSNPSSLWLPWQNTELPEALASTEMRMEIIEIQEHLKPMHRGHSHTGLRPYTNFSA